MAIHPDATGTAAGLTDGERWTRAALRDLRARRYAPSAWARFIGASAIRSVEDVRRRPDLAKRAAAISVAGCVPWVAVRRGRALAWWGTVSAMLLTHVGMLEGPNGERRAGLGGANTLTLIRAWLVPAVALARDRRVFAGLAGVAFATDVLDGRFARRHGHLTRLGAQMDHAVDASLAITMGEAARRRGWLSGWVVGLLAARYAAPIGLLTLHYFARAQPPPPTRLVSARAPGVLVAAGLVGSAGYRRPSEVLIVAGLLWGSAIAFASRR